MQQNKRKSMSVHGILFKEIEHIFSNIFTFFTRIFKVINIFFHSHETFFEFVFIAIYLIEQICLLVKLRNTSSEDINFVVAIFIAIFLTTIALEKILMRCRNKVSNDELTTLKSSSQNRENMMKGAMDKTIDDYNKLTETYYELIKDFNKLEKKYKTTKKKP